MDEHDIIREIDQWAGERTDALMGALLLALGRQTQAPVLRLQLLAVALTWSQLQPEHRQRLLIGLAERRTAQYWLNQ